MFRYDTNNKYRIDDENILTQIRAQVDEDEKISKSREELATEHAGDDQIFKYILQAHLEYNDGHIDPIVDDETGVTFYQVGQNSSHTFSIGVKDGQKYLMTFGESGFNEKTNKPEYAKKVKAQVTAVGNCSSCVNSFSISS